MTQHEWFQSANDDFMLFALKWDVCLFVLAGLGHFDLHAVLAANTSDSISEKNLLNSWEEAYIYNKSAAAKGPPSLQHTQHIKHGTKLYKSRHYLQIQRWSKACHAADRVNEKSTFTMASIQNVLRTFNTTYKFDVLFLNGAAASKGLKTHKIPLSLAAAGPVFQPSQLYRKILHILELTFGKIVSLLHVFWYCQKKRLNELLEGWIWIIPFN